jgi:hypothetical protein
MAVEAAPSGVYFSHAGISRIDPGSATPTPVVAHATVISSNKPGADGMLRVDDTHLYWAEADAIRRAPLATGIAELVASVSSVDFIGLDADNVYFNVREANTISKVPLAGGKVSDIAAGLQLQDMKVDGGYVYFSDVSSGRIGRVSVSGGSVEWLHDPVLFVRGISPSGSALYWVSDNAIESTPLGEPADATLLGYGGPGSVRATRINNMVLDNERLYWLDDGNNLGWTKIDGTQCDVIMGDIAGFVDDFAVDDRYAYVSFQQELVRVRY